MKRKKIVMLVFFLSIFIVMIITSISQRIEILDEMWNYNIARNIANGLIPYKDISMITSPLLSMITAIFIKFIDEIIITRILNAVVTTMILYFLYKILTKLEINEYVSYFIVAIISFILRVLFTLDYNIVVILIGIIILYFELLNIEKKKNIGYQNLKYEFFIGVLVGIAICVKQSVGLLILISSIIYNLIYMQEKKDIKQYIRLSFIRILGVSIPILVLFLYLLINGALYDFWDYCILGIKTFDNKINYIDLFSSESNLVKLISVGTPILYCICIIKIIYGIVSKQNVKELITILIYSISMFAIVFPIADNHHLLVGTLPSFPLLILILKDFNKIKSEEIYKLLKIGLRNINYIYNI